MPLDTSHFFDDIYLIITKDQLNILRNFYYATTGLSIFGSLFIIFTYLINKNLRNFSFSLIFYMTLSVLFQDISKLLSIWLPLEEINDPHDHRLCMVQAYLLNYSQVSTLIWCTIISWVLYGTVYLVRKNITIDIERFLLIGFGYPICISLM